ncbi:MAG: hypothetical protein AB7V48_05120 [Sedimentibacter sp.]
MKMGKLIYKPSNLETLETFLFSSKTVDSYKFAVGGICPKGLENTCSMQYKSLELAELGKNKSGYFIDFMLSKYIKELSAPYIKAVCASVRTCKEGELSGGVIGSPNKDTESANSELEEIEENLYLIALPGKMGIAFAANYQKSKEIYEYIMEQKDMPICSLVNNSVNFLESNSKTFILASDGSGEGSFGAVYTSGQKWSVL